jgi:hypothetical protein
MVGSRQAPRFRLGLALVAAATMTTSPLAAASSFAADAAPRMATPLPAGMSPDCRNDAAPVARANELLANGYLLRPKPLVTLPADLTWTENPFNDDNWQFQLHSMRYVLDLVEATEITGDPAYQARGLELLQDWYADNAVDAPSIWAWNDHSTALRAIVYACVAELTGMTTELHDALVLHGETLADPTFYVGGGNHALNQAIGLLEVGRLLARADWLQLAANRINALLAVSVDGQGVTNEQSVGYELYNLDRYTVARDRLVAVGLTPGPAFARLERMPDFLAAATRPDGRYEMIGDTQFSMARSIPGTFAEYMATQGVSGPQPPSLVSRFSAGYLFVRSGWGTKRAWPDESFWSLKWGAAPVYHGHADGMGLTLYGYGSSLVTDTGLYAYGGGTFRGYFKGRSGHNVVTVDGATWPLTASTRLMSYAATTRYIDVRLAATGYPGVTQYRRVTYSRALDYFLVQDKMSSSTTHTYRQLWHFREDANPAIGVSSVWTRRTRGNVLIRQLAGGTSQRIVKGTTSPIQGWISYSYGTKVAAPVAEVVLRGTGVRYLTLIVPAAGYPRAAVSNLTLTSTGYAVTIAIGGHSERVIVDGLTVSIRTLS